MSNKTSSIIIDPVRLKRQLKVIDRWGQAKGKGTLQAATAFGKTRTALEAIKLMREHYPDKDYDKRDVDVIVCVPTEYLKTQWEDVLEEEGIEDVQVWIINSLVKKNLSCYFLILDEIHGYTGDVFSLVFKRIKYKYILGLTATLPNDIRKNFIERYAPVIDTVTLEECKKNGWVAPFTVYNLGIKLSKEEEQKYKVISGKFGKFFGQFSRDLGLMYACLSNPAERAAYAHSLGWDEERVKIAAINGNRFLQKRVQFVYNHPDKIDAACRIIEDNPKAKIITFGQTIHVANTICEKIGKEALPYHSEVKGKRISGRYFGAKKMLHYHVERFKLSDYHTRVLSTAKALDQGADIPSVDFLILISSSSRSRQGLQRYGRGIRFLEGKHTVIVEIYLKNTVDERWLKRRQEDVPPDVINNISDISEIEYNKR